MPSRFLQALAERVVVLDGAMGTSIHAHDLDVERDYCGCENCPEVLLRSRPELIRSIHESFLAVGCDAVETDSFGGARHVLGEFGLDPETFELNRLAAAVAREACERFSTPDRPRFVVGSLGPGTKLITLGQIGWDDMLASYGEQARGLIAGGADALLIETCQDLLQIKCAINACLGALDEAGRATDDVPILVSVTIETTGTMLLGTSIEAAAAALSRYPIASLGLNCATGPTEMAEHVQYLARHWPRHVSVVPNAGLPVLHEGRAVFPLGPEPFAADLVRFVERDSVRLVGGCCGTTPEHIASLVRALDERGLREGGRAERTIVPLRAATTSLYAPVEHRQDTSFLIVGERMNASGSRRFKELLEAEDWDGIVSLARSQLREGSHLLDLNVDYAGRDNAGDMGEIVGRVVRQVDAPLMLDSTQIATIEAGLKRAPGTCIINSANFEDGEEKFDAVCRLAKVYGAALVIGTIDEDREAAMARTADRKLAIALRAHERATRHHGLAEEDLFFDPLVLPISTGMEADRRSALETIEGTRRIAAALPRCQMTCGVSNVSFGLAPAARIVLNSVFLHELVEAGMVSAIVHASKILPLNKIPEDQQRAALDLIYDRRHESLGGTGLPAGVADRAFDPLQAFIELFKGASAAAPEKRERAAQTLEERLRSHIVDGEKEGLPATLEEALARYSALDIINDHLLDGMKTVGELFGSGRMQLPFVLQSAEVMKMAVAHLEPHMEHVEGQTRGSIVLATVKGDVHDIGKNLVDVILTNNGYTVHNLGIKQPLSSILDAWREKRADAIGLSGLLVKSVNVMEENLRELNELGVTVPVILGGAALTRHYAEDRLRSIYEGPLYYGKDAFEGLRIMDLLSSRRTDELDAEIEARLTKRSEAEKVVAAARIERAKQAEAVGSGAVAVRERVRSDVSTEVGIPRPPFWGTRVVTGIDPAEVYPFINTVALFRGQWQFRKGRMSDAEYEAALAESIVPVFERWKARCRDEGILEPRVVYGYFPCQSDGDDLIVYDPEQGGHESRSELLRFTFPRQGKGRRLCISDFFAPTDSGRIDTVGFSCVTVGQRASDLSRELFARNDYTEYLYLHGLSVETAEALAELWHKRMRQELGIASDDSPRIRELFTQHYRGSRYSFGYPACPELSDQERLFRLLRPERIGCTLTENWQIEPEQSTSAIVVHHPEARYFNV